MNRPTIPAALVALGLALATATVAAESDTDIEVVTAEPAESAGTAESAEAAEPAPPAEVAETAESAPTPEAVEPAEDQPTMAPPPPIPEVDIPPIPPVDPSEPMEQPESAEGPGARRPVRPRAGKGLLEEGKRLFAREGRLATTKAGHAIFVFDSGDEPMKLLPSAWRQYLENVTDRGERLARWRISGMVTTYRGENYLLVTNVVRIMPEEENL